MTDLTTARALADAADDDKGGDDADLVNSDRYLPVSAISNTMRDAMLARGLVTAERLRERGVR